MSWQTDPVHRAVRAGMTLAGVRFVADIRATKDDNVFLRPPSRMGFEEDLEFIDHHALLEIAPAHIRVHERHLKEHGRKRAARRVS